YCARRTRPPSRVCSPRGRMRGRSMCRTRSATSRGRVGSVCRARTAWTDFSMRCWKRPVELAIVFVVLGFATGCGALREQAPGHLAVRDARIAAMVDGNVLVLGLDCRLSGPMRDALDHGIPI